VPLLNSQEDLTMKILWPAVSASVILTALSCGVAPSFAQNLPDAPSKTREKPWISPLKDPSFWAGTAFHASSVIADVHHTQACEHNLTCVEANPGADKYKNRIPEIAFIAGADYGCSLMLSEHKRWRFLCLVLPITIGIQHWRDATHIYRH
jgi:hypothetical protein